MNSQNHAAEMAPPSAVMTQMILSFMNTQAIYAVAKLGIADLLKDRPKSSAELAAETKTDARSLYRVLRALSSVGIFTETDPDCFGLTPLGETLRSDARGSLRGTAIFMGEDWHLHVWGDIMHSVLTGQPAIEHVYGLPVFPYMAQNPEAASVFNDAMTSMSASVAEAIIEAYDFSGIECLVDVAGGHGLFLSAILKAHPQMRGVLFDVAAVIEKAHTLIEAEGVRKRCGLASGDFFERVPAGRDAYIMKHIIHDWDDERALRILGNCRRAMNPAGKLLLVEMVVPSSNEPALAKFLDLEMLLFTGGCERTEAEYSELFERADFRLTKITPTQSPYSVIEAVPR